MQFDVFHLLKHFFWDKAHLADKGGILKSLEIEYNEVKDLALCTPAAQYKPMLTRSWAPLDLSLLDPSHVAK